MTVPALPLDDVGRASFQFAVRDSGVARRDVRRAQGVLAAAVGAQVSAGIDAPPATPKAVFLMGSMERGSRVFRFNSFESQQVAAGMKASGSADVPIAGLYGYGAFCDRGADAPLMEMDSVWAVLTSKTRVLDTGAGATTSSTTTTSAAAATAADTDVLSAVEKVHAFMLSRPTAHPTIVLTARLPSVSSTAPREI